MGVVQKFSGLHWRDPPTPPTPGHFLGAKMASSPIRCSQDTIAEPPSKRVRTASPVAFEVDANDECPEGIDAIVESSINERIKERVLSLVVKPPSTAPSRLAMDIYVGIDCTRSMRGNGEIGVATCLKNFKHLLAPYLNNLSDVCVHFFTFAETATACTDDLEPLDSVIEKDVAASIASALTFDGNLTNLECAVEYATACARRRLAAREASDLASGTRRTACLILLTDGAVTSGCHDAETIRQNLLSSLSDSMSHRMPIYALGLGCSTSPTFLSKLCRDGFWAHAHDPRDPTQAFKVTFGHVLSIYGIFDVEIDVEGRPEAGRTLSFGTLTSAMRRPRRVCIPLRGPLEEYLVVKVTLPALNACYTAQIPTLAKTDEATGTVPGLIAEYFDVCSARNRLLDAVQNEEPLDELSFDSRADATRRHVGHLQKTMSVPTMQWVDRESTQWLTSSSISFLGV